MTKLYFDRLPSLISNQFGYDDGLRWNNMSAEEQRKFLLETHDGLLQINQELVKLILEMEG
jgi:hypothetical protein